MRKIGYTKIIQVAVAQEHIDNAMCRDPDWCMIKVAVIGISNKCGREDAHYLYRDLADHRVLNHLADKAL
jgi:hypothetical protein